MQVVTSFNICLHWLTLGQAQLGVLDLSQTFYLFFQYYLKLSGIVTDRFTDYPNFNTSFLGFFGIYWNKADSRFGDDHLFINTKITSWYANCFENVTQNLSVFPSL